MRLTAEQRRVNQEETAAAFGKNTRIQLFGSRLDNASRCGPSTTMRVTPG